MRHKRTITRSDFSRYRRCPKQAWLANAGPPDNSTTTHTFLENQTLAAKLAAKGLFTNPKAQFDHTIKGELNAQLDILDPQGDKWDYYIVKAGTQMRTSNLWDAAYNAYVAETAGHTIRKIIGLTINTRYTRQQTLDLKKLFKSVDITRDVRALMAKVPSRINQAKQLLSDPHPPDVKIGTHCDRPFSCPFTEICKKDIPTPSVLTLRSVNLAQKYKWYHQGITTLDQVPKTDLLPLQLDQIEAHQANTVYCDTSALRQFLKTITYPLYVIDFEASQPVVPPFEGTSPLEQIPFLLSIHRQTTENGRLTHTDILISPGRLPYEKIAKKLIRTIPPDACILAFNSGYERHVIQNMARRLPAYSAKLQKIAGNIIDLMLPFTKGWLYLPEMNGSTSVKSILPALVPEMSYATLEIGKGDDAIAAYQALEATQNPWIRFKLKRQLRHYCKTDTLALIKILEKIRTYC